ncbi:hypothetical protein [Chryseobacterium sp.]|uniref:hypothetical protein n=1 Tax=Chryseobacterium sp. TaxID=1871047 RepID=UPI00289B6AE1|nr:hypothetical protein [Chryseobacterium sp.]
MKTTIKNCEIQNCVSRLENYNTLFDIENLFSILYDQMEKCHEELSQNYNDDAKNTLNKIFSMFWVIKDKLPNSLFEDIEKITDFVKLNH